MTWRIALLGAECTGKSSLTAELARRLADLRAATVAEYLREWCLQAGRTPTLDEQTLIAAEQQRRIAGAAQHHGLVVADTTALQTAFYSLHYFADRAGLAAAVEIQRGFDLTLLCSPSGVAWQADGCLRDSPEVREATHRKLHALLREQGLPFTVLVGPLRERAALAEALIRALPRRAEREAAVADEESAELHGLWSCSCCDWPRAEARLRSQSAPSRVLPR